MSFSGTSFRSKNCNPNSVRIGLIDPNIAQMWAHRVISDGTTLSPIKKGDTINHTTSQPIATGLFCQRIFGPCINYTCACGHEKIRIHVNANVSPPVCPECRVEWTESSVRRHRLGSIELVSPVIHKWFSETRNYIPILTGITVKSFKSLRECKLFFPFSLENKNFRVNYSINTKKTNNPTFTIKKTLKHSKSAVKLKHTSFQNPVQLKREDNSKDLNQISIKTDLKPLPSLRPLPKSFGLVLGADQKQGHNFKSKMIGPLRSMKTLLLLTKATHSTFLGKNSWIRFTNSNKSSFFYDKKQTASISFSFLIAKPALDQQLFIKNLTLSKIIESNETSISRSLLKKTNGVNSWNNFSFNTKDKKGPLEGVVTFEAQRAGPCFSIPESLESRSSTETLNFDTNFYLNISTTEILKKKKVLSQYFSNFQEDHLKGYRQPSIPTKTSLTRTLNNFNSFKTVLAEKAVNFKKISSYFLTNNSSDGNKIKQKIFLLQKNKQQLKSKKYDFYYKPFLSKDSFSSPVLLGTNPRNFSVVKANSSVNPKIIQNKTYKSKEFSNSVNLKSKSYFIYILSVKLKKMSKVLSLTEPLRLETLGSKLNGRLSFHSPKDISQIKNFSSYKISNRRFNNLLSFQCKRFNNNNCFPVGPSFTQPEDFRRQFLKFVANNGVIQAQDVPIVRYTNKKNANIEKSFSGLLKEQEAGLKEKLSQSEPYAISSLTKIQPYRKNPSTNIKNFNKKSNNNVFLSYSLKEKPTGPIKGKIELLKRFWPSLWLCPQGHNLFNTEMQDLDYQNSKVLAPWGSPLNQPPLGKNPRESKSSNQTVKSILFQTGGGGLQQYLGHINLEELVLILQNDLKEIAPRLSKSQRTRRVLSKIINDTVYQLNKTLQTKDSLLLSNSVNLASDSPLNQKSLNSTVFSKENKIQEKDLILTNLSDFLNPSSLNLLTESLEKKYKELKKEYKAVKKICSDFQNRKNAHKRRYKLAFQLLRTTSNPAGMTLSSIPVLPPGLRPIIDVPKIGPITADLNIRYRGLIFALRNLRELAYVDYRNAGAAQASVQEAVDDLLYTGGKTRRDKGVNSAPNLYKSLAMRLKGKHGRFRGNLLGKRVDYSGRSVIVVGPTLKIHQCGLPFEIAIKLFNPFLIRRLLQKGLCKNVYKAKQILLEGKFKPIIWTLCREVMLEHLVLLNRAPTLHRLGVQAFMPILISGRAILLHPLVCTGFNADFDGDQMGVHVPLFPQARAEAWKMMWSRNNFLSPSSGEPILLPSQDMVLGCYYLTESPLLSKLDNKNYQFKFKEQIQKTQTFSSNLLGGFPLSKFKDFSAIEKAWLKGPRTLFSQNQFSWNQTFQTILSSTSFTNRELLVSNAFLQNILVSKTKKHKTLTEILFQLQKSRFFTFIDESSWLEAKKTSDFLSQTEISLKTKEKIDTSVFYVYIKEFKNWFKYTDFFTSLTKSFWSLAQKSLLIKWSNQYMLIESQKNSNVTGLGTILNFKNKKLNPNISLFPNLTSCLIYLKNQKKEQLTSVNEIQNTQVYNRQTMLDNYRRGLFNIQTIVWVGIAPSNPKGLDLDPDLKAFNSGLKSQNLDPNIKANQNKKSLKLQTLKPQGSRFEGDSSLAAALELRITPYGVAQLLQTSATKKGLFSNSLLLPFKVKLNSTFDVSSMRTTIGRLLFNDVLEKIENLS